MFILLVLLLVRNLDMSWAFQGFRFLAALSRFAENAGNPFFYLLRAGLLTLLVLLEKQHSLLLSKSQFDHFASRDFNHPQP